MNKESGSAIFIILIAVALFAALGFAFMQGNRSSTSVMTDEAAKTYATNIISYGNDIRNAITRMKLSGIQPSQFDFGNTILLRNNGTVITAIGHNPNCTTAKCQVFSAQGGGLVPKKTINGSALNTESPGTPTAIQDGAWQAYEGKVDGVGTTENDIIYIAGYIKKDVCMMINQLLNVSKPGENPPKITTTLTTYNGSFTAGGSVSGGVVTGISSYCYEINSRPGVYNYLTTVLVR